MSPSSTPAHFSASLQVNQLPGELTEMAPKPMNLSPTAIPQLHTWSLGTTPRHPPLVFLACLDQLPRAHFLILTLGSSSCILQPPSREWNPRSRATNIFNSLIQLQLNRSTKPYIVVSRYRSHSACCGRVCAQAVWAAANERRGRLCNPHRSRLSKHLSKH